MRKQKQELAALGYRLVRNYHCPIRRKKMAYARLPVGAGSVCVFDTLAEVDRHVEKVKQTRQWEAEFPLHWPEG